MTAEEEIAAGLRNAVERGVPIDKAAQTFINAGYAESAVRSAVRAVNENISLSPAPSLPQMPKLQEPKETKEQSQPEPAVEKSVQVPAAAVPSSALPSSSQPMQESKEGGVSKTKIIVLVVVLVLLLVFLGASLAFRDQILAMLT